MDSKPLSKDSMRSTWRTAPRSEWNVNHWLLELLNVYPIALGQEVPVHSKKDKVPFMTQWSLHLWIIIHSGLPLILHEIYMTLTGCTIGQITASTFYFFSFTSTRIHQIHIIRRLGHKYGFLDGDKHERDGVPDVGVAKVVSVIYKAATFRTMLSIFLSYNAREKPSQMAWAWLLIEISLYGIVLDFFFYWYHRLMHEVSFLWKFHRTHHLTKHPNCLLLGYADHEQEFIEIVVMPMVTYFSLKLMGLPMGFYEWWICQEYVGFSEVVGHSGLRIHLIVPSTISWLLRLLSSELNIEDHDLHHRNGWRKSHNYGKQTRLWDRIFSTGNERLECAADNVDYENTVNMPFL
ncbi:uncharacterized protein N7446_003951 [Penicillium canescens]|uniref:Fatty acid hydroxylase domain-containing protein n=1 Tax=Penicillium canescens TaxID=5083 RepID=A0AAD6I2V4_PENCN|nr:uncharacterized protein N7446_003951 [Penicillium canescens]KAJ6027457.1 hypothetical protein N7460_012274 [Penicillium canescens]KAJ6040733.1 hypothetical protein N7444_009638 [Penicillium canescens]KAJ6066914.1 hypothetical protein N7446_003951 [Penicillium canescens]